MKQDNMTYRNIAAIKVAHVSVVPQAVARPAVDDARTAPTFQAKAERRAAVAVAFLPVALECLWSYQGLIRDRPPLVDESLLLWVIDGLLRCWLRLCRLRLCWLRLRWLLLWHAVLAAWFLHLIPWFLRRCSRIMVGPRRCGALRLEGGACFGVHYGAFVLLFGKEDGRDKHACRKERKLEKMAEA